MNQTSAPPLALDGARVIAYAIVDKDVRWTGRQKVFVGDERLGPVPRLAICQHVFGDDPEFLLFHCDETWRVLGVTTGATVEENMESAERWYEGITAKWILTGTTAEAAEKFLREQGADSSCSFCGNVLFQVDHIFSSTEPDSPGAARICSACIERMYGLVQSAKDDTD